MKISSAFKQFLFREVRYQFYKERFEYPVRNIPDLFNNFDELYFMMQNLIEYDVDEETIDGLSERLPYAINKIVDENLCRQDILTYFPIVWLKFEAYVKKIMYIVDPEGFKTFASNKNYTLPDYLKQLGINYFCPKNKRSIFTQTIYNATKLRNTESHDCEYWSITKCYQTLSESFLSYLFITEFCLEKLKISIQNGNLFTKISLYPGKRFVISSLSFFDINFKNEYPYIDFNKIKAIRYERGYTLFDKAIRHVKGYTLFDIVGLKTINDITNVIGDQIAHASTEYTTAHSKTYIEREEIIKSDDTWKVKERVHNNKSEARNKTIAKKSERNEIISLVKYRQVRKGITKKYIPSFEYAIEYNPNGGVEIKEYRYSRESENDNAEKELRNIYRFNYKGQLTEKEVPFRGRLLAEEKYVYADGYIQRIEINEIGSIEPKKGYYSFDTIHDYVFIRWHDDIMNEEKLTGRLLFKDDKLVQATKYLINEEGEQFEENTFYEYYSE